ncbi:30S ribosomal protein S6 [Buchnera aphidicola]|uniref:Small ribosomal subunit protein bS6 n=1 Tax=Buchnera aphidicola (Cinara laricifoliae) TaxID=2518977 RepID=A0A451DBU7_9GAMM|nr:30S ribosomal protein S6 [Buchnera aphidicola]VFP83854.1 30S ribosomal protein S6 [Buchnera aphidicola (Cinara laricifoliae)]
MRHYEIILMVHPDKSDKISHIIEFYSNMIKSKKGVIHRLEDWGQRSLSYTINKLKKAHYVLMNIEISIQYMQDLENDFKFNINIIRYLILLCNEAFKEKSPMLQTQEYIKKESISIKNNQNQVIIK